jgi:hypothetical protein
MTVTGEMVVLGEKGNKLPLFNDKSSIESPGTEPEILYFEAVIQLPESLLHVALALQLNFCCNICWF